MLSALILCVFVPVLASSVQADDGHEPLVAFLCGSPAMYLTEDGWVKDDGSGCLQDPTDILNYCRKVFPSLDVRNVVEGNQKVSVPNWCNFGQTTCNHQHSVTPFRCLEKKERSGGNHLTRAGESRISGSKKSTQTEKPKNDAFTEYVNQAVGGHKWNEHEYYMKAKGDMRVHHRDKVAKMMKDWAAARQRVQDLKAIDPKASEKLNKEITSRFQKMYEAEEVESEMEKKQLAMLHQQRVQADLNEKKQRALDNYMDAVEDYDADSSEVLKALKHYVKALQKDRLHTVNRYKHMQETDPAEAEATREHMAEHVRNVDQQLEDALTMLDRLPKFKNKIRTQIEDYLDSYHSIDASVSALLSSYAKSDNPETPKEEKPAEDDYNAEEDEYEDEETVVKGSKVAGTVTRGQKVKKVKEVKEEEIEEEEEEDDDINDDDKVFNSMTVAPPAAATTTVNAPLENDEIRLSESFGGDLGDDDDYIHEKRPAPAANMEKSYIHMNEPSYIQKTPLKGVNSFSAAVPLGIAVGGITVFVVIIVGVIVMRRRGTERRHPRTLAGAVDIDPAASPEERHVASMQMNGYENPTYKYFEMNSTTA